MKDSDMRRIDAGTGAAFEVSLGETLAITAPQGPQVADMWAFALPDISEFLSTEHTRSCVTRLTPRVGESFYTNHRNPILTIVNDTSPGDHDLLLSACDVARYTLLGHRGYHANCVDNLRSALAERGYELPEIPSPVNIFENVSVAADGALEIIPPHLSGGESVTMRAELDIILVISACPMDIVPTNGADRRPKPIDVYITSDVNS